VTSSLKSLALMCVPVAALTLPVNAAQTRQAQGTLCVSGKPNSPMSCAVSAALLTAQPDHFGQSYLFTTDDWATVHFGTFPEQKRSFDPLRAQSVPAELRFTAPRSASMLRLTLTDAKHDWTWTASRAQLAGLTKLYLPAGKYKLRVTAEHFKNQTIAIDATGASPIRLGTIELSPATLLSGRITDEATNDPLPGATVSTPDGSVLGVADGRGAFHVEVVDPELRFVLFDSPGYAMSKAAIASLEPNARVVLSRAATLALHIDPRETTTSTIRITLAQFKDDQLTVAAQKQVSVAEKDTTFSKLQPGRYRITLRGDAPLAQMSSDIELLPGKSTPYRIQIEPGNLLISVMFADQPLGDGTVEMSNSEKGIRGTLTLDDRGQAVTEAWQGGSVLAIIRSSVLPAPFLQYRTVELQPEMRLEFTIPNRRVVGEVRDRATGRPISGADVTLSSQTGGDSSSVVVQTDAAGHFEFKGVKAGNQSIQAAADKYLKGNPQPFAMGEGDALKSVPITLDAGITRIVRVTNSAGAPVARAAVITVVNGQMVGEDLTDANGSVAIPTPADIAPLLLVGGRDGSMAVRRIPAATPNGADTPPIDVVLPPPVATIKITAHSADQKPIANMGVLVRFDGEIIPLQAAPELHLLMYTNSAGEALLTHVPEGNYDFWPFEDSSEATALMASIPPPAVALKARAGLNQADITFDAR